MRFCSVCKRTWEDDFRICPIDGVPLQDMQGASDSLIGSNLGNCRIVEKIADGELGPVYKGEDPVRGAVAVQVVPQDRVSSPILLEAFTDAVNQSAKLQHPNVVRTFELQPTPDGSAAVFMEYFEAGDLKQYRQAHPGMPSHEACNLIRQTAEGLVSAHRISLLHGALHPSRILVDTSGNVKLTGFHRSGLREGMDVYSATPDTLPYLAPEQIGIVRDVPAPDYRTDVYALGVLLYELLAGRLPYEANTVQELATIMEGAPPLPPNFSNPQVSPLLSRLTLRAISKHPSERHGSVDEFIKELEATGQPVREPQQPVSAPYSPPYPPAGAQPPAYAPPQPTKSSDLFSPPPRKETADNLWPEAAQDQAKSGDGSVFGWFKTRVGRSQPSSHRHSSGTDLFRGDDSTMAGRSMPRGEYEDSDEHTVVVSSRGRRRKKRSMFDTFVGSRSRDMDLTGTGALPRRRLSGKVYIGLGIGAVLLLTIIFVLLYFTSTPPAGKLLVSSSPPGARVSINNDYRGETPLPYTELRPGTYTIRIELDGYETKVDTVEVLENSDIRREYVLLQQADIQPPPADMVPSSPVSPAPGPSTPAAQPQYERMINASIRSRNFFPPSPDNAWDLIQQWQRASAGAPPPALLQAQRGYCSEVELMGREKLDQKDFTGTRAILDKIRSLNADPSCISGLQSAYRQAVSSSLEELRISARAAMERGNYVTPETENALRYVRLMLTVDPRESEAGVLEGEIFTRAWDQAQAKSDAHEHQEALNIYTQLKEKYPNPPVDAASLDRNITRESRKLELLTAMRKPYSIQVKFRVGSRFLVFGSREDVGVLRIDGFGIDYKSSGEHSFNVTYDNLRSIRAERNKLTIEGVGVPEGKIEFQAVDRETNLNFSEVSAKIEEYRELYREYNS